MPNLNIVQGRGSSNATNIFIRGIGQPDALQTFDPAVGVYVDDVYLSRIRGNQLDLLDLERIEVLRGPQGTLYGKNTIGGAIKFVTRKPGQDFRADGSRRRRFVQPARAQGRRSRVRSATRSPLGVRRAALDARRLSSRIAVLDRRNITTRTPSAARGALAFTPTANVRIDLTADYSDDDAALNVGRPVNNLTHLVRRRRWSSPIRSDPATTTGRADHARPAQFDQADALWLRGHRGRST